jgi:hypothetical protein
LRSFSTGLFDSVPADDAVIADNLPLYGGIDMSHRQMAIALRKGFASSN